MLKRTTLTAAVLVVAVLAGAQPASAASLSLVSLSDSGQQGNFGSRNASVDASGSLVAFSSIASNLVPFDSNGAEDVFLRSPKGTERVSLTSGGQQGNGKSFQADISANGRRVAFASQADNLPCQHCDTNYTFDVFVRDFPSKVTLRISTGAKGDQPNGPSLEPSISADGNLIAFTSWASNIVPWDENGERDVFVYDVNATTTRLVSVQEPGKQFATGSHSPSISPDGRFVAFVVDLDEGWSKVVVHDLATGQTTEVSSADGAEYGGVNIQPSVSNGGLHVAWATTGRANQMGTGPFRIAVRQMTADYHWMTNVMTYPGTAIVSRPDATEALNPSIDSCRGYCYQVIYEERRGREPKQVWSADEPYPLNDPIRYLISENAFGGAGNGDSRAPDLSGYLGTIVFDSDATDLDTDVNGKSDVFVR